MLSFACGHCGQLVFFENSVCLHCGTPLGFVPERLELVALEGADGRRAAPLRQRRAGRLQLDGRARAGPAVPLVRADPHAPGRRRRRSGSPQFADAEAAKRRVIMQLLELGLPGVAPGRLSFDLLSSSAEPVADRPRRRRDHDRPGRVRRRPPRAAPRRARRALPDDARPPAPRARPLLPAAAGHRRRTPGTPAARCSATSAPTTARRSSATTSPGRPRTGPSASSAPTRPCTPGRTGPRPSPTTCTSATRCRPRPSTASPSTGPRAVADDRSLKATPQPDAAERGFDEVLDELAAADLRAERGQPQHGPRRPVPVHARAAGDRQARVRPRPRARGGTRAQPVTPAELTHPDTAAALDRDDSLRDFRQRFVTAPDDPSTSTATPWAGPRAPRRTASARSCRRAGAAA